ncbi:MAG TPA: hypothetical protein VK716_10945 [Terracidiphilus sp.]|jgi:hypothetical protein|nr:hypothetical protein [Terracidiphilus sp.]
MPYYTRVLTKQEDYPLFDEVADLIRAEHPQFKLHLEEGTEEDWESLLLASEDEVEVALIERNPVYDGSLGQDEIADFLEDLRDCKPDSGVEWLKEYLAEVKTIYAFQHLQGADSEEGSAALHGLRSALWDRGESIIQADLEGFTNEEGFHIVWQFSDTVSGAWNMAILQDGTWNHFKMDLGDPDQRAAFLRGEVPPDVASVQLARKED